MSIGQRLKEERERIGLNQTVLGAIGGVRKQAQLKYENDASSPNANYLFEISKIGMDIQYIVLGIRTQQAINEEETALLAAYRAATPEVRQFMLQGRKPPVQTIIQGKVGQQIQAGDYANISYKPDKERGK